MSIQPFSSGCEQCTELERVKAQNSKEILAIKKALEDVRAEVVVLQETLRAIENQTIPCALAAATPPAAHKVESCTPWKTQKEAEDAILWATQLYLFRNSIFFVTKK